MARLTPTIALTTCEQSLRELYGHAYPEHYGAAWLDHVATLEQREHWRRKRETEHNRRTSSGVVAIQRSELAYAEFYELCAIAESHWGPLAPALGKQKQTLPLLRRLEALRNTVAHSRLLLPFEEDLLSGIAGEIRNRVTIYMTDKDPSGNYFARIESVSDSLGHTLTGDPSVLPHQGLMTGATVRVGDLLHFTCRATDPHGRPLTWVLQVTPGGPGTSVSAEGADTELTWNVTGANVGDLVGVIIGMAPDAPHHRLDGKWDGRMFFHYRVLPR